MTKEELAKEIKTELQRIGATEQEGELSGGITAWIDGETVFVGDEGHQEEATLETLDRLREVPDNAGWEAAWEAI